MDDCLLYGDSNILYMESQWKKMQMYAFVQYSVFVITHKNGFTEKINRNKKYSLCNRYSVQS